MKPDVPHGTLVCVDARREHGGAAATARLSRWTHPSYDPYDDVIGDIPLAADGSFMVKVPVDTPLRFTLLDTAGKTLVREHGPFWVRNNEVRVCVSCHDDVETAPPNRRPAAVLDDALDLSGGTR